MSETISLPLIAEFTGTFIFVLLVLCIILGKLSISSNILTALVVGLSLAFCVMLTSTLGGSGHLNPAISTAAYLGGKLDSTGLVSHIITQILSAVLAFVVFKYTTGYQLSK